MGNGLANPIREAVLAEVTNRGIAFTLAALTTPLAVIVEPVAEVMAQQRAMANSNRVDLWQGVHAFQRLQNTAGVRAH